jgi:hypothetical protein
VWNSWREEDKNCALGIVHVNMLQTNHVKLLKGKRVLRIV